MGGNVWQWCGDDYPNIHYRYLRGGSHENYEYNLFVWARNSAGPDYYSMFFGFRCARDAAEKKPAETVEPEENKENDVK
jgi:formylglycine-generating enzyme required for sulfatase activity